MLAAQGGANLIYGAGMLDLGITFDMGQLILDNEMYSMIRKVINGVQVNDDTLAVNLIRELGPGGEFVSHPHTFEHFRTEQSAPKIFCRTMRETWEMEGKTTAEERADAEVKRILDSHKVMPLPEGAASAIRSIIEEAEEEYKES